MKDIERTILALDAIRRKIETLVAERDFLMSDAEGQIKIQEKIKELKEQIKSLL